MKTVALLLRSCIVFYGFHRISELEVTDRFLGSGLLSHRVRIPLSSHPRMGDADDEENKEQNEEEDRRKGQ